MPLNAKEKKATEHVNKLGAGAKKRKSLEPKSKVKVVMDEWKHGKLHSGSGEIVPKSNQKQAVAIALSEARRSGAKIPKKKK